MQHVLRCWETQSDGLEYKKTLRRPLRKKTSLNLGSELLLAFQELGIKADLVKTHVMFTTDCGVNIARPCAEATVLQ